MSTPSTYDGSLLAMPTPAARIDKPVGILRRQKEEPVKTGISAETKAKFDAIRENLAKASAFTKPSRGKQMRIF